MPGPSNQKKRSKRDAKKHAQRKSRSERPSASLVLELDALVLEPTLKSLDDPIADEADSARPLEVDDKPPTKTHAQTPPQILRLPSFSPGSDPFLPAFTSGEATDIDTSALPTPPAIHDPGTGPRVRSPHAFLASKFFVQPPALTDPLCAEFAREEVREMLCSVLPEEMALILWYNKSRATSRICPTCRRLYRLGDILPDHTRLHGHGGEKDKDHLPLLDPGSRKKRPELEREQELSGLCSPLCFILASWPWAHPRTKSDAPVPVDTISATWGRTACEIADEAWAGMGMDEGLYVDDEGLEGDRGLSMLLKMTRLDDLGLAQLLGLDDGSGEEGCE
ncbi:hypothetical protein PLICRDRAFT_46433 [Plicaturopsis crispa FD-325 SS-3]|uniref:C2H2-type domain-containing protein n=1 Tax=Plicaturopsis crispa FD-325 SS-3 TaxID=944288 RepID=A0A0C9SKP5_PLICR|nr:hypothetical protein PLICRDRAFT_46433 [Plicaturopsis crispa FD-325 SS-3]